MKKLAIILILLIVTQARSQKKSFEIETKSVTIENLIEFIVNDFEFKTGVKSNITIVVETKNTSISRDKKFFLKQAIHLTSKRLNTTDKITVISYNKNNGVVIKPTNVSNKETILNKIMRFKIKEYDDLFGIDLAYNLAKDNYEDNGRNLVLIVRDGENFVVDVEEEKRNDGKGKAVKAGIVINAIGLLPELISAIKN